MITENSPTFIATKSCGCTIGMHLNMMHDDKRLPEMVIDWKKSKYKVKTVRLFEARKLLTNCIHESKTKKTAEVHEIESSAKHL